MFDKKVLDDSKELKQKWEDQVKKTVAKHADQKKKNGQPYLIYQ